MKKALYALLVIAALISLLYFVAYPYVQEKMQEKKPDNVVLASADGVDGNLISDKWEKKEEVVYEKRDYRSIEEDFGRIGYPPFQYLQDGIGAYTTSGEKSIHENGMMVYLYMDNDYYLQKALIEYPVPANQFSSIAMDKNIQPFYDFVKIITNHELSQQDKTALIREFTNVFNEQDEQHSIKINGLEFELSIDTFFKSIKMSTK